MLSQRDWLARYSAQSIARSLRQSPFLTICQIKSQLFQITGIGAISVKVPRARDRKKNNKQDIIRFASQIPPPYVRRSKSIEATIPYLYLKGISSGDFS